MHRLKEHCSNVNTHAHEKRERTGGKKNKKTSQPGPCPTSGIKQAQNPPEESQGILKILKRGKVIESRPEKDSFM